MKKPVGHTKSFGRFDLDYHRLMNFYDISIDALPGYTEVLKNATEEVSRNPEDNLVAKINSIKKIDGPDAGELEGEKLKEMKKLAGFIFQKIMQDTTDKAIKSLSDNLTLVNEQSLVFLVTLLDTYLDDVLYELSSRLIPQRLFKKEQDKKIEKFIENHLSSLRAIRDKIASLRKIFSLEINLPPEIDNIIEERKSLVHKGGILAQKREEKNQPEPFTKEDFLKRCERVHKFVLAIDSEAFHQL